MVPSKDDGISITYTNALTVKLMVIPTPDGKDTIMELLPFLSMKDDDVVTLSPTEVKVSETSVPERFTTNDPLSLPRPTYLISIEYV